MGWFQAILGGVSATNQMTDNVKATQLSIAEANDNKQMALSAATDAVARGNSEAARTRMQGGQLAGEQNMAYANSGVDPTVGTPANVIADTKAISELDATTQENNAAREAWGFKRYGLKYGQQASLEAARGSNKNAATALTGISSMASGFAQSWGKK